MADDLSEEFLTTRELASLLRIKERKVYELAAGGEVPCSRATGKLLFPRAAVDAWLAQASTGPLASAAPVRAEVFAGSHDPLLEWALRECGAALATYFDGSLDGVERFASRAALAAGVHVRDAASGAWNVPLVTARFAGEPAVLVEFAWRERGLLVAAGCQVLLEQLLAEAGVAPDALALTGVARTETDAALAVAGGEADAAFGLAALARQLRLEFVPVIRERFDLLVDRHAWFEPALQRFWRFCASEAFRRRARELDGYDVSGLGTVHFNGG